MQNEMQENRSFSSAVQEIAYESSNKSIHHDMKKSNALQKGNIWPQENKET
jgi:hypothetical protein